MKLKHIALLLAMLCLLTSMPTVAQESGIYYDFDTSSSIQEAFGGESGAHLADGYSG